MIGRSKQLFIETRRGGPGDRDQHTDGFICGHCRKMVTVKPFTDPVQANGFCSTCMSVVCRECSAKQTCTPWEREMEQYEARQAALRSYGLEN